MSWAWTMPKHRGRFKWKKYSKYKGMLRDYWVAQDRLAEHRWDKRD